MDAASLRQWIAELDAHLESGAVPARGELHIWLVPLHAPELVAHHRHTLAPDEAARELSKWLSLVSGRAAANT